MSMDEPKPQQAVNTDVESVLPTLPWSARILSRLSILGPLVLAFQKRSIEQRVLAGFGLVFAGILVIVNFLSARHTKQWDFSETQRFTLSPQTYRVR